MIRLAKEWNALHSDRLLQYGDIARPGGINTPDHSTHKTGKAFDVRLQRKDNSTGGFSYTQTAVYNQPLTKEFILLGVQLYPGTTFLFNDPVLNETDKDTRDIVNPSAGHNDHLHVMFPGGKE